MFVGATNLEEGLMLGMGYVGSMTRPSAFTTSLVFLICILSLRISYLLLITSYTHTCPHFFFVVVVAPQLSQTYYLKSSRTF